MPISLSGSLSLTGSIVASGNLTTTGTITAQTLVVQTITSSIVNITGSNIFGSQLTDRQTFTGSFYQTGSLAYFGGNVGIGVTLNNWATDDKAIQIGGNASIYSKSTSGATKSFSLMQNAYDAAGGFTYISTDLATRYNQISGQHQWYTAPSATAGAIMTFTQSMTLNATGNLGIGTISPVSTANYIFTTTNGTNGSGYITQVNGVTSLYVYSNANDSRIAEQRALPLIFETSGTQRMSINAAGTASFTANVLASAGDAATINLKQNSTTANTGIYLERSGEQKGYYIYMGGSVDSLTFQRNNAGTKADVMSLTRDGNVGIGTVSPSQLFEVVGGEIKAGRVDSSLEGGQLSFGRASDNTTAWYIDAYGNGASPQLRFVDTTGAAVRMMITGSNVGVGVTPSNWASGVTALQVGTATSLWNRSSDNLLVLASNSYYDGSIDRQITTNTSNRIYFVNAATYFERAASTAAGSQTPWSTSMTISAAGSIGAPSGTNIYNASDLRLKRNITTITEGLSKINALNPVKFNWINDFEPDENDKDLLGFIAQEVQTVIPEAVEQFGGNSIMVGETLIDNPLRVNEKFLIPVLVKAIQEQQCTINLLKTCIGIS